MFKSAHCADSCTLLSLAQKFTYCYCQWVFFLCVFDYRINGITKNTSVILYFADKRKIVYFMMVTSIRHWVHKKTVLRISYKPELFGFKANKSNRKTSTHTTLSCDLLFPRFSSYLLNKHLIQSKRIDLCDATFHIYSILLCTHNISHPKT